MNQGHNNKHIKEAIRDQLEVGCLSISICTQFFLTLGPPLPSSFSAARSCCLINKTGLTLTSRAFYNHILGVFEKRLHDMFGYDKALPMNVSSPVSVSFK